MEHLNEETLQVIAAQFRVLSEPVRLHLLHELRGGERSVNELAARAGISQPSASKHLSALREQGLVSRRKEGTSARFSIAADFVFELCDIVCDGVRQDLERRRAALPAHLEPVTRR